MSHALLDKTLIHRLLQGDDTALSAVVDAYSISLLRTFKRIYPTLNEDEIWTFMDDAFLKLYTTPEKYDPSKGTLLNYLRMDIDGDLKNYLRTTKRVGLAVPLEACDKDSTLLPSTLGLQMDLRKLLDQIYTELKRIFPQDPDYTVACLVVERIREREIYAKALGLQGDFAHHVDRIKDRVTKKLSRHRWEATLKRLRG